MHACAQSKNRDSLLTQNLTAFAAPAHLSPVHERTGQLSVAPRSSSMPPTLLPPI